MPTLSSKKECKSGVPLGGIGTGKLEILPNGLLSSFTLLNNWGEPIAGSDSYPGVLGYHFGVFEDAEEVAAKFSPRAFMLQTVPAGGAAAVESIEYKGSFASAQLDYRHPGLKTQIRLEAFTPWIPGDIKSTGMPVVFFRLRASNQQVHPVRLSFLFMGRNLSGSWCVGRRNQIEENDKRLGLNFLNTKAAWHDPRRGQMLWSFEKKGWRLSFVESWNAVTKNFHLGPDDISLAPWDIFSRTGKLPNLRSGVAAMGENREFCGAVAASSVLKKGEKKDLLFSLCWHFPGQPEGHYRKRWFSGVKKISSYAISRRASLERKTRIFQNLVFSLPFPEWFNDALLTNLAPFFSATRHLANGRFAFYEAPSVCPLMGTIDVGFYGSVPLAYFFPKLEQSQILQFAAAQSADGYIPHDLGKNRLDCPSSGTTFYEWKDLNPKFVLMSWRDYVWSGESAFLRKIYPHVKMAIAWSLAQDADGNGLPDHEGADQTFDLWDMRGVSPYTASLFLAALLAARQMARHLKDPRFEKECNRALLKGRDSFERELWTGRFFGKDFCALAQLNGQWYADLLGLGSIADDVKIRTAIRTIFVKNGRHSRFGMVNSVLPNGRLDTSNNHARNVWAGMNYAFLSLALMRGFALTNVLKEVGKIWNNTVYRQHSPWNQPDMVDSKTGRYLFGDAYYRNMAIWSIPMAYAKNNKKTAEILIRLKSIR